MIDWEMRRWQQRQLIIGAAATDEEYAESLARVRTELREQSFGEEVDEWTDAEVCDRCYDNLSDGNGGWGEQRDQMDRDWAIVGMRSTWVQHAEQVRDERGWRE